jgi:hypothetical protein
MKEVESMKRIEKRINKKTGEELQQYLHFRKRGYIQKNKIKNIPRKRKHKGEF